eukprot:m.244648 g.244648  ORF g.244648 m.244648 type:complete len:608 (+) comp19474_c0_seq4:392-2215(+)
MRFADRERTHTAPVEVDSGSAPENTMSPAKMEMVVQWFAKGLLTNEQLAWLLGPDNHASSDGSGGPIPALSAVLALEVSGAPTSLDIVSAVDSVLVAYGGPRRQKESDHALADCQGKEDGQKSSIASAECESKDSEGMKTIDAGSTTATVAPTSAGGVKEVVVLCIDVSASMSTPFDADDDVRTVDRTRLEGVKQMFYGFRDQTSNHENGSKHLLGLLSYDKKIYVHTEPTANFDAFEEAIDEMRAGGMTAIYAAITKACQMLSHTVAELKLDGSSLDLRVICLSDGQNNCNEITANDALTALMDVGAVCDCVIVGKSADEPLRKLVQATEGECFQVDGLSDAYEILESPAVLSLESRRNGAPQPVPIRLRRDQPVIDLATVAPAETRKGPFVTPQHASDAEDKIDRYITTDECVAAYTGVWKQPQERRLLKELRDDWKSDGISVGANGRVVVFPAISKSERDDNCRELMALLLPSKGAYKGRVVKVRVQIPSTYPFRPPAITFITSMYSHAISTSGNVCLEVLRDQWSPAVTIAKVLQQLVHLVSDPADFDPLGTAALRSWLSEQLRVDPTQFATDALAHASTNAALIPDGDLLGAELLQTFAAVP